MKRCKVLLLTMYLMLTGCAGTGNLQSIATEMVPGRAYEVMTAGHSYFTFTLDAPAHVVLESQTFPGVAGYVAPAGQLLDADGRVVARDWNSGADSNFRIERQLQPGAWYLRVTTPHTAPTAAGDMDRDYRYAVMLRIMDAR